MRIITGKYKGRHFDIPRSFKARPTTDFAKENIFNVLNAYIDFDGATALDLFAGTGSISLELLSRGCRQVVSVELDRDHYRFIQQCVGKLEGAKERSFVSTLIRGDVFRFLKSCKQPFNFIFADPPYALKELSSIPDLIFREREETGEREGKDSSLLTPRSSLLTEDGIFVLEHGKDHDFTHHPHFIEHRHYGSVNFSLFR